METRIEPITLREFLDKKYPGWRGKYPTASYFTAIYKEVMTQKKNLFFTSIKKDYILVVSMRREEEGGSLKRLLRVHDKGIFNSEVKPILLEYEEITGEKFVIIERHEF